MRIKIGSMLVMMTISFLAKSQETLLLRHPSVSGDKIAFAYASDIWVANKNGSNPVRLTVNPDVEFNPIISPDGKSIVLYVWYDNEYGYTRQVIRFSKYIAEVRRMVYY